MYARGVIPGQMLAVTSRTSGSDTQYSTASATDSDVDATNLAVTFTAPPSGSVSVTLSGTANNSAANNGFWTIREGSSTLVSFLIGTGTGFARTRIALITGLTPGTSYTYKWGYYRVTNGTWFLYYGTPSYGPLTMVVQAAP